jgi:hypothetical protein
VDTVKLTRFSVCSVYAMKEYTMLSRNVNEVDQYAIYTHAC